MCLLGGFFFCKWKKWNGSYDLSNFSSFNLYNSEEKYIRLVPSARLYLLDSFIGIGIQWFPYSNFTQKCNRNIIAKRNGMLDKSRQWEIVKELNRKKASNKLKYFKKLKNLFSFPNNSQVLIPDVGSLLIISTSPVVSAIELLIYEV